MSKSVYSVILDDDLVVKLDQVAFENGVSRSVMLDKILANYLTVETPTVRMENIFQEVERLVNNYSGLRFVNQASNSMVSVQSSLVYKYRPTVRYVVGLYPEGELLGVIKISLRSQSPALFAVMNEFYSFFVKMEKKYVGPRKYTFEDGKFCRELKRPENLSTTDIGTQIANYVRLFDLFLNGYIKNYENAEEELLYIESEFAAKYGSKILI